MKRRAKILLQLSMFRICVVKYFLPMHFQELLILFCRKFKSYELEIKYINVLLLLELDFAKNTKVKTNPFLFLTTLNSDLQSFKLTYVSFLNSTCFIEIIFINI